MLLNSKCLIFKFCFPSVDNGIVLYDCFFIKSGPN